MENIGSIIITALVTLLVTVLAGLALEYVKRIKPKLKYSIKESVPIDLGDKKIGANIIEISNPSSKSVKDIVLKLRAKDVDIKNGGIKTITGLDYEIIEGEDVLEIKIPFLKFKDYLSITAILESKFFIPNKPEITVRSPDTFKLVEDGDKNDKASSSILITGILPAMIAAVAVAASLGTNLVSSRSDQGINLSLAAAVVGLPNLAEHYVNNDKVYYYNQGPLVYALAKSSGDLNKITKYGDFLENTLIIAPYMNSRSKSALQFFIAKIRELKGDESIANKWFSESKSSHEDEYNQLVDYFKSESINKAFKRN